MSSKTERATRAIAPVSWRRAFKANCSQVFFVVLAFFLMVTVGYLSVGEIVSRQGIRSLDEAILTAEANVMAGLSKSEIVLDQAAEGVQELLDEGASSGEVWLYLANASKWMRMSESWGIQLKGVYGYLNGDFINGLGMYHTPPWYRPQESEWYDTGARNQQARNTAYTQPYRDDKPGGNGRFIISSVRNVHDANDAYHGMIAIDLDMSWFRDVVRNLRPANDGYIVVLNKYMVVIAHPGEEFVGSLFRDICDGYREISRSILGGEPVSTRRITDVDGGDVVASFRRMPNDWHIGVIVPQASYYRATHNAAAILAALGLFLTAILVYILLRLSMARMRSEEANWNKSNVLARMSHEIRTPMNAVIGMSELARREYGTPKGLEYVMGIKTAGTALLGIINDILDFSKIESGLLELADAPYETASLLNDVLTIISVRMREKPLELMVDIDPAIPRVLVGDAARIRQILLNLLSNAAKYTDSGWVRLSVSGENVDWMDNAGIRLTMAVADSGRGIRREDMPKLFRDFSRVDSKKNSAIEGTGLGLTIARRLCAAMSGDITVESEYGKGSTFTARLIQTVPDWTPIGDIPVTSAARVETKRASFVAPDAAVLLVDDLSSNLLVAEGLLAPYKLQVSACRSGREALEQVRERDFDLVFMDYMMPEMDGMEAAAAIRALGGRNARLPVIALTANVVSGMREKFLANGFNDMLAKPIELSRLDSVLRQWIPSGKQRENTAPDSARMEAPAIGRNHPPKRPRNLLAAFRRDAVESLPLLEKTPGEEGLKVFVTRVHGLKSGLANIGEEELSRMAAILEEAGRNRTMPVIEEKLPPFRDALTNLVALLDRELAEPAVAARAAEEDGVDDSLEKDALESLRDSLAARTVDAIDSAMARLESLPLSGKTRAAVSELGDLILTADLEEAERLARSLLEESEHGKR